MIDQETLLRLKAKTVVVTGFTANDPRGYVRIGDFVKMVAASQLAASTLDSDIVVGVAAGSAFNGQPVPLTVNGLVRLRSASAIGVGDPIGSTSVPGDPGRGEVWTQGLLSPPRPAPPCRALTAATLGGTFYAFLNPVR